MTINNSKGEMHMISNKRVINLFIEEGYNDKNFSAVMQLLSADYIDHSPAGSSSPEAAVDTLKQVTAAFPDLHAEILDLVEENNKVVGRFLFTGTHNGDYMGIPATGKSISFEAIEMFFLEDSKIIESWGYWPDSSILEQLTK